MGKRGRRIAAIAALIAGLIAVAVWLASRRGATDAASADVGGAPSARASAKTSAGSAVEPKRWAAIEARRAGLDAKLPALTLRGRVVDRDDRPVAGADVVLEEPARATKTDEEGQFAFAELPPGAYRVDARKGADVAEPRPVVLGASSPAIVLRLYGGMRAQLEVVSAADERPIAGARVSMKMTYTYGRRAGLYSGTTDDRGLVELPGVSFNPHDVRVSAPGFVDRWMGPSFAERRGVLWRYRVELEPGAQITGKVVGPNGQAINGAVVEVKPFDRGYRATDESKRAAQFGTADPATMAVRGWGATTDASGAFRIGVSRGEWVVVATHADYAAAASDPVFVEGRDQTVEIALTAGAQVAGVVVDQADEPVPGARVEFRWGAAHDHVARIVQADGTGAFATRGLPAAPLEMVAISDTATGAPRDIDLTRPAPEHQRVVLVLDNAESITGVVVDAERGPVRDALVTVLQVPAADGALRAFPRMLRAGDDGRFEIRGVARGVDYHISAMRPQDRSFVRVEAWTLARAGDEVRIELPATGRVVGRVVKRGRGPVAGLSVVDPGGYNRALTDKRGRFEFTGLQPRTYRFRVSGPGITDAFVDGVEVGPGDRVDVGDVEVVAGRRVAGRVLAPDGSPVAVATLWLRVADRYQLRLQSREGGVFDTTAPDDVALTLEAEHELFGNSQPMDLAVGEDSSDLTVQLLSGGTIEGEAVQGGAPMAERPVLAWPGDGPRPAKPTRSAVTDDAGAFALANMPEGVYDVELLLPEDPSSIGTIYVYRQTVRVERGETVVVRFDASAGREGAEPMDMPQEPELPTRTPSHGSEAGHDH